MNTFLWVLQGILAVKFLSVAYTHGIGPESAEMRRGLERLGSMGRHVLLVVTLASALGALVMVLPLVRPGQAHLVPWAAALLGGLMLPAIGLHLGCREKPRIAVSLVLLALAAVVAYGRWVLVPLP